MVSGTSKFRYLLDTNIIVYLNDPQDIVRQMRANQLIIRLKTLQNAALPAQVLAEFINVAVRKLKPHMDLRAIEQQIEGYIQDFTVLPLTQEIVIEALQGVRNYQFSYYDAQIWAVARLHQIPIVLSEDFNSGSTVGQVTFINPFDNTFDLTTLFP
ncbi:MAG: PIN domain-containing protein [Symploca sp. SIO2E6]|nr:PIN domain-containing protein [Symploca sp. SIO2E6]